MVVNIIFFRKFFILYSFLIIFSYFILIKSETDFDYHRKKRLNNGNYLVMTTQGIYLYKENFSTKIGLIIFESRLIESNSGMYTSDIEQFSTEDNGYIICLIKNEIYFLSKKGDLLSHITLDYIKEGNTYNIIPIGHSNNEFYYSIITIENQKITNVKVDEKNNITKI